MRTGFSYLGFYLGALYGTESFFGGGDAEKQIVDGGYKRGKFSRSLDLG